MFLNEKRGLLLVERVESIREIPYAKGYTYTEQIYRCVCECGRIVLKSKRFLKVGRNLDCGDRDCRLKTLEQRGVKSKIPSGRGLWARGNAWRKNVVTAPETFQQFQQRTRCNRRVYETKEYLDLFW